MKKYLLLALFLTALLSPLSARAEEAAPQPQNSTSTDASYTVLPGDVLQITVWKEDGLDREVLVLPDGDLTFPLVGTLSARGLTPAKLQEAIKDKLTPYIPNATVTVVVKAALGHTVSVIGQVAKPGEIVMSRRLTALQALSQAGGLTPFASEGRIIVVRHQGDRSDSIEVPYDDLVRGDDLDKDVALQPGDIIVVPTASLL